MSAFEQWSVGAVFYSTLVVAEALGTTGTAQVTDLQANADNIYTPAYAIYENGNVARVVLMNYVTDPSGASTYTASIGFGGGPVPQQVTVKYLLAPSVSEKSNISWAGQVRPRMDSCPQPQVLTPACPRRHSADSSSQVRFSLLSQGKSLLVF